MYEEERRQPQAVKVVDRRRFDAGGEIRPGHVEREAAPPAVTPPAPAAAPPGHGGAADHGERQQERGDFLGFVAQLGTQALASLGTLPEGQSRGIAPNPQVAREIIDILQMLAQRTRGNLSPQEDASFTRLVAELQVQYVRQARGAKPAGTGMPAPPDPRR